MRSLLRVVLWLPKEIFYQHYVLYVSLTTPKACWADMERRCEAMHQRLFGDGGVL